MLKSPEQIAAAFTHTQKRPPSWFTIVAPELTAAPALWSNSTKLILPFAGPYDPIGKQLGEFLGSSGLVQTDYGQAFDPANSHLEFSNDQSFDFSGNNITIMMWSVYRADTNGAFLDNTAGNNDGYKLIHTTGNSIRWRLAGAGVNVDISFDGGVDFTTAFSVGDLFLTVASFDGATSRLYVYNWNTVESASKSSAATQASMATGDPLYIGEDQAFAGVLDHYILYGVIYDAYHPAEFFSPYQCCPFSMLRPAGF